MNSYSNLEAAGPGTVATVYQHRGPALRVPLRPASQGGQPEQQFMRWFRQQAAAEPSFPLRVKSILLTGEPLCPACHRALGQFLNRYRLASRLRVQAGPAAGAGCSCQHGGAGGAAGAKPSSSATVLDELLAESELENEGLFGRAADWVKKKIAEKKLRDALRQVPPSATNPYDANPGAGGPVVGAPVQNPGRPAPPRGPYR